jgi:hypothetical protein
MNSEKESYCIRVEIFMIEDLWEKCIPFLANPEIGEIEYSSMEELKRDCLENITQLWILMKGDELVGCFLTNVGVASDTVNVVNIFNLSGTDIESWIKELDTKMVEFCQQNSCKYYSYVGRPGFKKFVPELTSPGIFYLREVPNV